MRVFVLGGTGAIGGHAVPALIAAGHEVTAVARSSTKAATLRRRGACPVSVPIFDRGALAEAFAGHDAVVNLATSIPPTATFALYRAWRENDRIRSEGSAAVTDAAMAADVGVLVQESVAMLYPDCGSRWINEDVLPEAFPTSRGNLAAEANVARFVAGGGTGIVLRFGWFLGPGARHSEQFLALARWHVAPVIGHPDGYVSSIHLADAASGVVAALDAPGGTYNVVDDEPLTKREFAAALANGVGVRPWFRGPGRAAAVLGDRLTSLTRSLRVSNRRFREATRWTPRHPSTREAWRATAIETSRRR